MDYFFQNFKVKILLFFLLFITNISIAQKTSISGYIFDVKNNYPIALSEILLVRNNKIINSTFSNEDGFFEIKIESKLPDKITINAMGYDNFSKELNSSELKENIHFSNIKLTPDILSLPSVEIIGVKNSDYLLLSGTASKLDANKLSQISAIGTQEALEYIPGINAFSDDGIGNSRISVGIRGINPRRSSRTLILEDGIPIQPALYVYSSMYYNPPVERINEIEVKKGGSSIEHGPHSMGGVINYITNRPRKDFGGKIFISSGSNKYLSSMIELGGFGTEKFRPEFQFLYKSGDGFRDNNSFIQFNGTFKMMFVPSKKRKIYVNLNVDNEKSNATYTGLTEYSFLNNHLFNPKENDEFIVNRYAINIIQQRKISSKIEENTKLYFNYFDRDWWREFDVFTSASDYEDGVFTEIPLNLSADVNDLVRVGGGNSNFGILRTFMVAGIDHQYLWNHKFKDSINASLNFGARFHFERFIDRAGIGDSPTARTGVYYRANNYETYAYSFFLKEKIILGDLILSPGIRFEIFEQEMINRLSNNRLDDKTTFCYLPGIGFNYDAKFGNFFGGIHRGMTPPSNSTLLILNFGETTNTQFEGLELKPETSVNYELGFRSSKRIIDLELTGFYIKIVDLISAARGTSFSNLGMVTSQGVESSINFKFSNLNKWLPNLFGNYTFLTTKIHDGVLTNSAISDTTIPDVSGNELPYAPRHNMIIGFSYNIMDVFEIFFNYKYVSRCFSDFENIDYSFNRGDTGPIPAYWLFNATVNLRIKKSFRFFATAKNIFNKKYIGSRLHSNPGQKYASSSSGIMPGLGRQINIGLSYNF
ncbi:MAG: TonB-dependent receptor [Crocinitomicaceae bacterium]|nr:TonB-dependent receptor [Crocinitomicaceae bacterium]